MNLKDLMEKLDSIAEAPDPARAQYDKFKADDAKSTAIAQVKSMMKPNGEANFIDPKDGIIKYQERSEAGTGGGGTKEFSYDWFKKGQEPQFFGVLKAAGLEVIPVTKKSLFGTYQVAGVSPQQLADIDKPTTEPTPSPAQRLPGQDTGPAEDIKKLNDLVAQLENGKGGAEPETTIPKEPTKNYPPGVLPPEKTLGQKAGIGAGIGAGALAGGALGKKFGGAKGAALGALTGGALGGLGVNALQKEGVEFNSNIAQALTESFGYEYDEQLDEYSMDQFGKDAGDFGRGAWNGVTLGTGDNIVAGVKSALGPGTYKDELAKQTAASKEAEQRSPWLYGAGNVAGSLAVPVPGGAIAGGLIKGASTGAKLARGGVALGTNLAAQAGIDKVKQASDTKTLGYDPSKYPTTPQEIMAFQKANGLTADGKIGPKTAGVLAKLGLKPAAAPTVAESIKSMQDKLAMIESGQWRLEEDADYTVWLLEDGTIVGEQGEVITNETVLESIEWTSAIDEGVMDAIGKVGKGLAQGWKNPGVTNIVKKGAQGLGAKGGALAKKGVQWVGKNPGKAALGAAGALGAGALAYNAMKTPGSDETGTGSETGTTIPGGGGGTTTPSTPTATPDAPNPTTDATGVTPEQQALIDQIKEIMSHEWGDDPTWIKATGHAQVVLDKVTKANPAQLAADAKNDTGAQTASASPAGTTDTTNSIDKVAQGAVKDFQKSNMPQFTPKEEGVNESDIELSRWLKIARG